MVGMGTSSFEFIYNNSFKISQIIILIYPLAQI